jgi:hypothetical protein
MALTMFLTFIAITLGIRWCCLCLLVVVPWSSRPWALPFLTVPVLSEKTCKRLKKTHRSGIWWTCSLLEKVRAWYPERKIVLVGDGGYAAVELVAACQRLKRTLVSRLRLDAHLHAFVGEQPTSKRAEEACRRLIQRSPSVPVGEGQIEKGTLIVDLLATDENDDEQLGRAMREVLNALAPN